MPEKTASARGRMDQQLAQAVDFARENAVEVGGEASVGEHLSFEMDAERLGTHYFACNDAGYVGWRWSVTLTRVPRSRKITVCEVDLVPGSGALLAPEWLPWEDRLQPGDVSREDVLPYRIASWDWGAFAFSRIKVTTMLQSAGTPRNAVLSVAVVPSRPVRPAVSL